MTTVSLLAAWLLADFLSGIVHWWEDRYGDPAWPVVGRLVISPNILHHSDQLAFVQEGYWGRNWTTLVPASAAAIAAWFAGSPFLSATFAIASQGNEIHSWAHQKCSRPIRGLQLLGVLCSPEYHAAHHRQPFDRNYCTISDWVNPVLSAVGFWWTLESAIRLCSGMSPRVEREVA